ncbi:MAG: hypothetical protein FWG01_00750 [Betaproteobacteria bacterium]|nr:hypothetical protein [Betaproteobacteria bacterium]
MRRTNGYTSEMTSGAVTAVQESKASSADSTTVKLSGKAMDQYAADQNNAAIKNETSQSPIEQAGQETAEKASSSVTGGSDSITEILERLQALLKEAQERLKIALQQMTQAMAEMQNAGDESQKMAAMMKVQAAQILVIGAQGEVLEIYTQINKILEEQQKQTKGTGSGG